MLSREQRELLGRLAKCPRHLGQRLTDVERRMAQGLEASGWVERYGLPGMLFFRITEEGRAGLSRTSFLLNTEPLFRWEESEVTTPDPSS